MTGNFYIFHIKNISVVNPENRLIEFGFVRQQKLLSFSYKEMMSTFRRRSRTFKKTTTTTTYYYGRNPVLQQSLRKSIKSLNNRQRIQRRSLVPQLVVEHQLATSAAHCNSATQTVSKSTFLNRAKSRRQSSRMSANPVSSEPLPETQAIKQE